MKHIRPIRPEDPLKDFAPVGTKECQSKCDREVLMTRKGPVIVCNACKRVVMDNRDGM
jgi:hypothetical protein